MNPPDPESLLEALDPEQRQVATALHGPVAVIAGAGTGKTRAITHRIAHGIAVGAYDPRAVLAVTFTTRAAGELRGRLRELGAPAVQARTFHSAALRQAQYFWPRVMGGELPAVIESRAKLVAEAASRLRVPFDSSVLRDLVSEIGWAKVSNVTAADYPALARSGGRALASVEPEVVARVFEAYEQTKSERGRIDFDDILLCTTALLAEHAEVADEVRRTYRHLVVDEYQDVSPLQQSLLELWTGDRAEMCVVGDPAQTIHSFAGARAEFLTGFAARHPRATVVRLVRDYRSTPQVVELANRVLRPITGTGALQAVTLQAQRPSGPAVEMDGAADEPGEAQGVARWLKSLHAQGIDYREMAVLFRINAQSPAFEQALSDEDIPYLVRGAERFYERAEVRQAMGMLRAATRAGESHEDVTEQVRTIVEGIGWERTAPTGGGARRERWESLAALVAVAEDLSAQDRFTTLDAVVDELERRASTQHAPLAHGVTLGTIHSAKGLEWDAVAVTGVHEGTLPFVLAQTPEQVAEERRLLYVAITRARERLRISWSHSRSGGGGRPASRFLDGVRPGTSSPASPRGERRTRRPPERGSQLTARCRVCTETLTSSIERKLGRHESCFTDLDPELLECLHTWRSEQAEKQRVPAWAIFTDATLQAIAEQRPADTKGLLAIPGVGRRKLDRYCEDLLRLLERSA